MTDIDFGLTADDYATHRAGFPDSLFSNLQQQGIGTSGQKIVDLGTGVGYLGRGFARQGAIVTGVDIAPQLLAQAQALDAAAGVQLHYHHAPAEATGLPAATFNVVSAGQCWHWFNRPQAATEARRLLRQGGTLLICHFDWLPLKGNVVTATEALILRYNPAWTMANGNGIYPCWPRDVAEAGFLNIKTYTYDEPVNYSPTAWRGRIRASAGVGASLPAEDIARFDADLATLLRTDFPGEKLAVPHRIFVLTAQAPHH